MPIRIAHEAPLAVFDLVAEKTDYLYALVHLFEENEAYFQKFKDAVDAGRHVILDNSVFELEEAFDSDRYLYWINKLKPTEYIIPDVLEDSYSTITKLGEWQALYQPQVTSGSTTIGVVQGRSYDDLVWCYGHVEPNVDKVAISFDYSWLIPENTPEELREKMFMKGRQQLIHDLNVSDVVNKDKAHHLLGCFCPQEFAAYKGIEWIDTIDTSNPVVAGIKGIKYEEHGLDKKPRQKLFTMMDDVLTDKQVSLIQYNIEQFRKFCK